ncbi:glycosyltransferase [Undibacterium terreum]|nr:glycosyltransferase [Undibacterium terreum]
MQRSKASERHAAEPLISGLHVLRTQSLPIEPIPVLSAINDLLVWRNIKSQIRQLNIDENWDVGIGRPSKLALWAIKSLKPRAKFMDVMDDFPAFYNGISRYSMEQVQKYLVAGCDYLFCSEESLVPKLAVLDRKKSIRVIPNGYDMERLPFFSEIKQKREIIGFVGTIASWFDWGLVIEIAEALPNICVQLIGPRAGYVPANLPRNIELLPACTVAEAIAYCQNFKVGLIPFVHNQLTESVDPIKYYELRALGVPIWTTNFGSMTKRTSEPGVTLIQPGSDWKKLWLEKSNSSFGETEIFAFRKKHDWSLRFKNMAVWLNLKEEN